MIMIIIIMNNITIIPREAAPQASLAYIDEFVCIYIYIYVNVCICI